MDSLYQASFTPEQGERQEVIRDQMQEKKKEKLYLADDQSPSLRILIKTNEWFFQEEMVSSLIHEVCKYYYHVNSRLVISYTMKAFLSVFIPIMYFHFHQSAVL